MHVAELTRFVIGIIGNVIFGLLFLSPSPTFWRIIKNKSKEDFHPYPYIATVMNCLLRIFYGLPMVHKKGTLVVTINGASLLLELIYLTIFLIYCSKKKYRAIILLMLVVEVGFLALVAGLSLGLLHTISKRSMVVGIICDVFRVIMYASPLSILAQVVKTKSAECLPVWICLAGFLNGICWFTYANIYAFDPYIAIGNWIGAVLEFIQLCFWGYYTFIYPINHPSGDKDNETKGQETWRCKKVKRCWCEIKQRKKIEISSSIA